MTKTLNRMADLYSRLSQIGLPKKYVQEVALPDWWCDEFEQSEGAVINAASYAARRLNLDLESLLESKSLPTFNLTGKPKFKAVKGSDCNKFSGAGVAAHAPNKDNAIKFLEYLASDQAQKYFASGNDEYPVVAGIATDSPVQQLGTFKADSINVAAYGTNQAKAQEIYNSVGYK